MLFCQTNKTIILFSILLSSLFVPLNCTSWIHLAEQSLSEVKWIESRMRMNRTIYEHTKLILRSMIESVELSEVVTKKIDSNCIEPRVYLAYLLYDKLIEILARFLIDYLGQKMCRKI